MEYLAGFITYIKSSGIWGLTSANAASRSVHLARGDYSEIIPIQLHPYKDSPNLSWIQKI